jgi:hypothetical protein
MRPRGSSRCSGTEGALLPNPLATVCASALSGYSAAANWDGGVGGGAGDGVEQRRGEQRELRVYAGHGEHAGVGGVDVVIGDKAVSRRGGLGVPRVAQDIVEGKRVCGEVVDRRGQCQQHVHVVRRVEAQQHRLRAHAGPCSHISYTKNSSCRDAGHGGITKTRFLKATAHLCGAACRMQLFRHALHMCMPATNTKKTNSGLTPLAEARLPSRPMIAGPVAAKGPQCENLHTQQITCEDNGT